MDEKEAVVTYETLFDLLMREKSREELQKLDESFYKDVTGYLNEKNELVSKQTKVDLFSFSEKEKTEKQIYNIKKLIKELYERRERKILQMALNKSRTKTAIFDSTCLLEHEKKIFAAFIEILNSGRKNVLLQLLNGEEPLDLFKDPEITLIKPKDIKTDVDFVPKTRVLRFLHPVPRFVGLELEEYGPFDEDDIVSLPTELAEVLIAKKRAEEIKQ